jgi:hypothetical protein
MMMATMMIAAALGCALLPMTVPVNPIVGVEMSREGSNYVISYKNCFDPKMVLDLKGVTVTRIVNGQRSDSPHCRVWWADFDVRSAKKWTYGTTPAGYKSDRCEPLVPGDTYEVHVSAGAGGSGVFSVGADGSVKSVRSGCK